MKRIGLISDTHGYLDEKVVKYFTDCDEIWHGGDIGNLEVVESLNTIKPVRAVYGNVDGQEIRIRYPEVLQFELEGFRVLMIHIAGAALKYTNQVKSLIKEYRPNMLICGHSHILKVVTDKTFDNMLYINPGAAGKHGFHKIKTIMTLELNQGKIENMKAIELGKRGQI